ncbi:MAG TPA: hypothetical protein PKK01_09985 [Mycobacterium sp.]|jgi:hypothetical protein|nr:hypothetical protein [Mycobacterium sp.]HPZ95822.1 hypothetical protein [Mycobacterium sp.]HQE14117.1 hypothetical protein [Mycobacterium sp.]
MYRWISAGVLLLGLLLGGSVLGGLSGSVPQSTAQDLPLTPAAGPVGPDTVMAGVYVTNIQSVDRTTNSFDADFYVWLRWSNPDIDPTTGFEIMNVYESWALTQTPVYEKPKPQPDGSRVWLVRYQGSFNSPLSLSDYPFEKQTLKIVIEDADDNVTRIVYEPDADPITLDPNITLAGYNFAQPRIKFDTNTYGSSFGDVGTTAEDRTYTRITVEMPVSSPAVSGIVKIVMPIIIVLIASGLGLIIPATYVDSKVNVPITALLALVAMHFVIATSLPEVSYLLMVDVVYLLAYATVTAMLAGAVRGAWVLKSRGEDAAMALERRFLAVTSTIFIVAVAAVFIFYLA